MRPKVATLPGHIQAVYIQNAAKLFATVLKGQEGNTDNTASQEISQLMIDRLPLFVQSANLEVQERVRHRRTFVMQLSLQTIRLTPLAYVRHLVLRRPASFSWSSTFRSYSRRMWKYLKK